MTLTNLRLRGFRSYIAEQSVDLAPDLTVLAGQNNVGKTALLRSVRQPVDGQPGAAADFMVEYAWELQEAEIRAALTHEGQQLLADHLPQAPVRVRARFVSQLPALRASDVDSGVDARIGTVALSEVEIVGTDLHAMPRQNVAGNRLWWSNPGFGNEPDTVWGMRYLWNLVVRLVSTSVYIHPRRTGSQPMPFQVTTALHADGSNLTTVIATLYTNYRTTIFRQLERFICAAFTDVARIDVVMGAGTPPQATVNLVYGDEAGQPVPLADCGTGIEQMLMLATAVLTAQPAQVFLIDEPHAFLHPSAERHLLRFINSHAQHQYVVATHSPVFLNSAALNRCRLITRTAEGSVVRDVSDVAEILAEVGVTPADLWSADGILWIEGPSDRKIAEALVGAVDGLDDVNIRVVPMPDWIRSTASSAAKAQATVDFCHAVREAVLPIRVESLFVFDGDERSQALRDEILLATQERARFLPVREVENLFLHASVIQPILAEICAGANRREPTLEQIENDIQALIEDTANPRMYRARGAEPDAAKVVGSQLLEDLWWKWALASYDKVDDGPKLVAAALLANPDGLHPFTGLVMVLAELIRATRPAGR